MTAANSTLISVFLQQLFIPEEDVERRKLLRHRGEDLNVASLVLDSVVPSDGFPSTFATYTALDGSPLRIIRRGAGYNVNGIPIMRSNILANNGIVHVINDIPVNDDSEEDDDTPVKRKPKAKASKSTSVSTKSHSIKRHHTRVRRPGGRQRNRNRARERPLTSDGPRTRNVFRMSKSTNSKSESRQRWY